MHRFSANVAQLVEQRIRNAQVVGSTPTVGSTLFPCKPPFCPINTGIPCISPLIARACSDLSGHFKTLRGLVYKKYTPPIEKGSRFARRLQAGRMFGAMPTHGQGRDRSRAAAKRAGRGAGKQAGGIIAGSAVNGMAADIQRPHGIADDVEHGPQVWPENDRVDRNPGAR